MRRDGVDHNREDMSINQLWPGYVAGEWHNNHHLYPKSARSGFKPYQFDLAWCYIKMMSMLGRSKLIPRFESRLFERILYSCAGCSTGGYTGY
jgi:fatty-acid desaturase